MRLFRASSVQNTVPCPKQMTNEYLFNCESNPTCFEYNQSGWLIGKESTWEGRRCCLNPWVRRIPWKRTWQSTPVFLPEKVHGPKNLVDYSPWGHKESDTTETVHKHRSMRVFAGSIMWQGRQSGLFLRLTLVDLIFHVCHLVGKDSFSQSGRPVLPCQSSQTPCPSQWLQNCPL